MCTGYRLVVGAHLGRERIPSLFVNAPEMRKTRKRRRRGKGGGERREEKAIGER